MGSRSVDLSSLLSADAGSNSSGSSSDSDVDIGAVIAAKVAGWADDDDDDYDDYGDDDGADGVNGDDDKGDGNSADIVDNRNTGDDVQGEEAVETRSVDDAVLKNPNAIINLRQWTLQPAFGLGATPPDQANRSSQPTAADDNNQQRSDVSDDSSESDDSDNYSSDDDDILNASFSDEENDSDTKRLHKRLEDPYSYPSLSPASEIASPNADAVAIQTSPLPPLNKRPKDLRHTLAERSLRVKENQEKIQRAIIQEKYLNENKDVEESRSTLVAADALMLGKKVLELEQCISEAQRGRRNAEQDVVRLSSKVQDLTARLESSEVSNKLLQEEVQSMRMADYQRQQQLSSRQTRECNAIKRLFNMAGVDATEEEGDEMEPADGDSRIEDGVVSMVEELLSKLIEVWEEEAAALTQQWSEEVQRSVSEVSSAAGVKQQQLDQEIEYLKHSLQEVDEEFNRSTLENNETIAKLRNENENILRELELKVADEEWMMAEVNRRVAEVEKVSKDELRSAVERKMREALLKKMKPKVRLECEAILREEIREELLQTMQNRETQPSQVVKASSTKVVSPSRNIGLKRQPVPLHTLEKSNNDVSAASHNKKHDLSRRMVDDGNSIAAAAARIEEREHARMLAERQRVEEEKRIQDEGAVIANITASRRNVSDVSSKSGPTSLPLPILDGLNIFLPNSDLMNIVDKWSSREAAAQQRLLNLLPNGDKDSLRLPGGPLVKKLEDLWENTEESFERRLFLWQTIVTTPNERSQQALILSEITRMEEIQARWNDILIIIKKREFVKRKLALLQARLTAELNDDSDGRTDGDDNPASVDELDRVFGLLLSSTKNIVQVLSLALSTPVPYRGINYRVIVALDVAELHAAGIDLEVNNSSSLRADVRPSNEMKSSNNEILKSNNDKEKIQQFTSKIPIPRSKSVPKRPDSQTFTTPNYSAQVTHKALSKEKRSISTERVRPPLPVGRLQQSPTPSPIRKSGFVTKKRT